MKKEIINSDNTGILKQYKPNLSWQNVRIKWQKPIRVKRQKEKD